MVFFILWELCVTCEIDSKQADRRNEELIHDFSNYSFGGNVVILFLIANRALK